MYTFARFNINFVHNEDLAKDLHILDFSAASGTIWQMKPTEFFTILSNFSLILGHIELHFFHIFIFVRS